MNSLERIKSATGTGNGLEKGISAGDKDRQFNDRSAIKHLKELHIEEQKRKYPSLNYYSSPDYSASKTNGLTKCVLAFLKLKGHQAERISCEGRVLDTRKTFIDSVGYNRTVGSVTRIKSSGQPGTADISATIAGRSVKVEVKNKSTRDRQSEAQKRYQAEVEKSGGKYFIVSGFAQFLNTYYSNFGGLQ